MHAALVQAIQLDTLDAVLALATHPLLAGVYVVADPAHAPLPAQIEILPDTGGGLNAVLAAAAAELAKRFPADGVLAMVGDLPALRSAELLAVLQAAELHDRSFVADAGGTGTTLLAAAAGHRLQPAFGLDSAARHADSGAYPLDAAVTVRTDVDSAADLRRCLELGVGMLTEQLVPELA